MVTSCIQVCWICVNGTAGGLVELYSAIGSNRVAKEKQTLSHAYETEKAIQDPVSLADRPRQS